LETLVGNAISLRLCDTDGKNYYLSQVNESKNKSTTQEFEETKEGEESEPEKINVPVTVLFN